MINISGHGSTTAQAILVADGGSDSDIKSGYALTGQAEDTLRGLCRANNLHFDEFYRTALIKDRINLTKPEANIDLLTDEYKRILIDEINTINPNVLVPLGELSFQFLTGIKLKNKKGDDAKGGIRKFRGSVLPSDLSIHLSRQLRVIPVLGPNPYLYEDVKMAFISRLDLGKVKTNLSETGPIKEIGNCWVCKSPEGFREFINRHYEKSKFLVFDIETFANIPTCISFCFDGWESCTVPLLDWDIDFDTRSILLMLVSKLLASDKPKINQNIKFDWRKLRRLGIEVNNIIGDTMLAANLLYCEFPKKLGFLTSIYTDMPYFKEEGKEYDPTIARKDRLYMYCAKDSLATHQIATIQAEELNELGVEDVYKMLITILPIYREMEENGILIDDTERIKLLNKYENLYQIYSYKLIQLVGRPINPLSSKAIATLVYDELKYKPVRGIARNKGGSYKADEESLELLMWMSESESFSYDGKQILRTIIDCRKLHKVIEILRLPPRSDGRFTCEFNLAGTETGRTTAGESSDYYLIFDKGKVKLRNLGHSLQTIGKHGFAVDGVTYGKDIRGIFIPSPGYIFVENDLSQAEARVDAVLAEDYDILKIFDTPTGIHRLTGSWVFDCRPEDIKKNILVDGKDRYHESKTVRHAGERNMMEDRLMMMIHRPKSECATILKKFHDNQPNIRQVFHREIREKIQKERLLIAPNGRRRNFFGRFDQNTINEGISFLPQAIVTDYLKSSLNKTINQCRDFVRPLAEAHDGFLSEVRLGEQENYGKVFKENVEQYIDFRKCSLARDFELMIPCECAIGPNWKDLKEIKFD